MKKATVTGLLMVFGLFLALILMQCYLATGDVSLDNLTTKTSQGPVAYQPLESETLTSLGIQVEEEDGQKSLFASSTFLYTLMCTMVFILAPLFDLWRKHKMKFKETKATTEIKE